MHHTGSTGLCIGFTHTSVRMTSVAECFASPSEKVLDLCTKEQLLKIADHYDVDVGDKCLKDRVKAILKVN